MFRLQDGEFGFVRDPGWHLSMLAEGSGVDTKGFERKDRKGKARRTLRKAGKNAEKGRGEHREDRGKRWEHGYVFSLRSLRLSFAIFAIKSFWYPPHTAVSTSNFANLRLRQRPVPCVLGFLASSAGSSRPPGRILRDNNVACALRTRRSRGSRGRSLPPENLSTE